MNIKPQVEQMAALLHRTIAFDGTTPDLCKPASQFLATLIRKKTGCVATACCGMLVHPASGEGLWHWWTEWDNHIIDVTIRQLGNDWGVDWPDVLMVAESPVAYAPAVLLRNPHEANEFKKQEPRFELVEFVERWEAALREAEGN